MYVGRDEQARSELRNRILHLRDCQHLDQRNLFECSFFFDYCRDVSDGQISRSPTVDLRYKVWKYLERQLSESRDSL